MAFEFMKKPTAFYKTLPVQWGYKPGEFMSMDFGMAEMRLMGHYHAYGRTTRSPCKCDCPICEELNKTKKEDEMTEKAKTELVDPETKIPFPSNCVKRVGEGECKGCKRAERLRKEQEKMDKKEQKWDKKEMVEALSKSIEHWGEKKTHLRIVGSELGLEYGYEIDMGNCVVCKLISGREDGALRYGTCGGEGCPLTLGGDDDCGYIEEVDKAMLSGDLPATLKAMDKMIEFMEEQKVELEEEIVNEKPKEKPFPKLMVHKGSKECVILATGKNNNSFVGFRVRAGGGEWETEVGRESKTWSPEFKDYDGYVLLSNEEIHTVNDRLLNTMGIQIEGHDVQLGK